MPDGWLAIAPDLRGFGASEAGSLDGWSMDVFADDVAALLDSLAVPRAVVCGLSMGGYVAFAFWRRHRERVRGLVLADTRAGADSEEGRAGRHAVAEEVLVKGSAVVARAMLPRLLAAATRDEAPEVVDRVRSMMENTAPASIARAQRAMAERPDSTGDLAGIDVPVLVVTGEEDVLTGPAEARAMVDALPRATLALIPGAGHLSPVERPAAFNAALYAFLRSLPGDRG